MRFTANEIARAVNGSLRGDDIVIHGVSIDSRSVVGGDVFVPIVADRDGHEFIQDALAAGAAAYLTSATPPDTAGAAIVVDDTGRALLELGRYARSRLADSGVGRVVGITGSVGKTTVKDLTRAALATRLTVHASPRSFNNELGVPITLANSPEGVEAVVIEMGARGRGHISDLCAIARPTVGIVTTIALAHAEMFGTVEEVAAAKGELVEALPPGGTAVLNRDHPLVAAMASRTYARVLTFGTETEPAGVDVTASKVVLDAELRPSFRLHSPWGGADVLLHVRGAHQVMNALAAAAGALACGVLPEDVADGLAGAGLAGAPMSPWRMDLQRAASGALVLNDAYNANPTSMEAALRALAALSAYRRIAVLGVMAELGPSGPEEHRRIAELADELEIDLIAIGTRDYGVPAIAVGDIDAALAALSDLGDGDAVLVKGSRVAGLERLAEKLVT